MAASRPSCTACRCDRAAAHHGPELPPETPLGEAIDAGYRVIAPDMIGMGRSDKPVEISDYSYLDHVRWIAAST
jgi:pimeloyl-ACP methyl ester carboxylesterase